MMLSTRTSLRNIRPRKDCSVEATEREEEELSSALISSSRSLNPKFIMKCSRSTLETTNCRVNPSNLVSCHSFKILGDALHSQLDTSIHPVRTNRYNFIQSIIKMGNKGDGDNKRIVHRRKMNPVNQETQKSVKQPNSVLDLNTYRPLDSELKMTPNSISPKKVALTKAKPASLCNLLLTKGSQTPQKQPNGPAFHFKPYFGNQNKGSSKRPYKNSSKVPTEALLKAIDYSQEELNLIKSVAKPSLNPHEAHHRPPALLDLELTKPSPKRVLQALKFDYQRPIFDKAPHQNYNSTLVRKPAPKRDILATYRNLNK